MFQFRLEPDLALLTVTRAGVWSLSTVEIYETALREQLESLRKFGTSTSFIIDIRSSGTQPRAVADALKAMVRRLGPLHAKRNAVVTATGIAKLQAIRIADDNAQVFTSMVLARDWVLGSPAPARVLGLVHDIPSEAEAEPSTVHVHGPADVDVTLTAVAALETARRIRNAALEVVRTSTSSILAEAEKSL